MLQPALCRPSSSHTSRQRLPLSLGGHRQKVLRSLDWLQLRLSSLQQRTPDDEERKDGTRARREFDAPRGFANVSCADRFVWPRSLRLLRAAIAPGPEEGFTRTARAG